MSLDSSSDSGVKQVLKASYDQQARQRNGEKMQSWKIDELNGFLARLEKGGGSKRVLDLGSGPGHQADYLREHGCEVMCIDLSEEMVAICREKDSKPTPWISLPWICNQRRLMRFGQ